MRSIRCNKEMFSVDILENTHTGKNCWVVIFYGVKYNFLPYYRLGSKDPNSGSTLYALGNFIADHRIPRMIFTDSDGVFGAGKKRKHLLRRMLSPLLLYEPDKHIQNPFERAIKNFKSGLSKIRNAFGTGVLAYHCKAMDYLCSINNHVSRGSLRNRLPFETF